MYQITCDGHVLYDPRDDDLILLNPKCNLGANTVGEGSFTILSNHLHYDKLKRLKSIFEIQQNGQPIFRGRMTNQSRDFYNRMDVDLEGVLGFTNDTVIHPFDFPKDFEEASSAKNVVECFLGWVLQEHNDQVEPWQRLKLGKVTVSDPNNYLHRYSEEYESTWEILKSRLFESELGGYLIIRYEADGNYVDYVDKFEETSPQQITFGENLLDITHKTDANETYSAIIPLGKETQVETGSDYEGDYVDIVNTVKERVSLKNVPDSFLTDDLVKKGMFIYSLSAKEKYGWICAPVDSTTWDDITTVDELKSKAIAYMSKSAIMLSDTIDIKALDLSFTDDQIQAFRIYQNVIVNSPAHGLSNVVYPLTRLEIDITNPQNTKITLGETKRVMTDRTQDAQKVNQDFSRINAQLNDKVGRTENNQVVSMVNKSKNTINLTGNRFSVESNNFGMTEDGTIRASAGLIGGCSIVDGTLQIKAVNIVEKLKSDKIDANGISAKNVDITGKITANTGKIGAWEILSNGILASTTTSETDGKIYGMALDPRISNFDGSLGYFPNVIAIGYFSGGVGGTWNNANFRVTSDGKLYAKAGEIGGCKIVNGALEIAPNNISGQLTAKHINADGIKANNVNITGAFTTTSGQYNIGGDLLTYSDSAIVDTGKITVYSEILTKGMSLPEKHSNVIKGDYINLEHYWASGEFDAQTRIGSGSLEVFVQGDGYTHIHSSKIDICTRDKAEAASMYVDSNNGAMFYIKSKFGTTFLGTVKNASGETIITSDRNAKNSIDDLSEAYGILFDNLRPVVYRYNNGTSNRLHTGFIAQEVYEAMENAGLTSEEFACVCIDKNEDQDSWGLRYSELLALCVKEIQKLKQQTNQIKGEVR